MGCRCSSSKAEGKPAKPRGFPFPGKGLLGLHGPKAAAFAEHDPKPGVLQLSRFGVSGRYHKLPQRIEDDYRILDEVLGTGYAGAVVGAVSRRGGQKFAVKGLHVRGISAADMDRLTTEAEIFLSMDHPHIARLVDVYEGDKHLSLVMERMEGGELLERVLQRRRFSETEAAEAVYQMLLAIAYIHDHGVVHRDLKLQNFLYSTPGGDQLKLIDFGFSHVWDPNTRMARGCGTLGYTAPEVLAGSYTSKCDLWSLGVITFILITGQALFPGAPAHQMESIMLGEWRKPPSWGGLAGHTRDFIERLLAFDPPARPSAQEALKHPFVNGAVPDVPLEGTVVEAICRYAQASRFRRACLSFMAWSLSDKERADVQEAFKAIDKNQLGTITLGELKEAITSKFEMTDVEVKRIFDALDTGADEKIHYSEFLAAMVSTRISMHQDQLISTFKRFDADNSGYITAANLQEVVGESFDGVSAAELFQEADCDGDGRISLDEFVSYIRGSADSPYVTIASRVIDGLQRQESLAKRGAGRRLACLGRCGCVPCSLARDTAAARLAAMADAAARRLPALCGCPSLMPGADVPEVLEVMQSRLSDYSLMRSETSDPRERKPQKTVRISLSSTEIIDYRVSSSSLDAFPRFRSVPRRSRANPPKGHAPSSS